jgi:hypothetical protein
MAVALATGLGLTVSAGVAAADTITQTYTCWPGGGLKTMNVTVTAPAAVTSGQPAPVHVVLEDTVPWTGAELAAGQARFVAFVTLGGAGSGEVQVSPLTNLTAVPPGGTYRIERTQQFTFTTAGTVTLSVRAWGVPIYAACYTPNGVTPPVAETLTVLP